MKRFVRTAIWPLVPRQFKELYSSSRSNRPGLLFDGDDLLFKATIDRDSVYGEYGCGASTVWVAKNVGCEILAVDSSIEWLEKVRAECGSFAKLSLHHADVGPVGDWGRPVSYRNSANFADYTDWMWSNIKKPNVVLVDGRFRVCCFLTSLIHGEEGASILFDDYTNRPHYHYVEKYIKPLEVCGRQALFKIPAKEALDVEDIQGSIDRFRYVFD